MCKCAFEFVRWERAVKIISRWHISRIPHLTAYGTLTHATSASLLRVLRPRSCFDGSYIFPVFRERGQVFRSGASKYRVPDPHRGITAHRRRIRQDGALQAMRLSRGTSNLTVAFKSQARRTARIASRMMNRCEIISE